MRVGVAQMSERQQATSGGTAYCVCAVTEIHGMVFRFGGAAQHVEILKLYSLKQNISNILS